MIKEILAIVEDAEQAATFLSNVANFADARGAMLRVASLDPSLVLAAEVAPFGQHYKPDIELMRDDADNVAAIEAMLAGAGCRYEVLGFHDDIDWLVDAVRESRQLADLIAIGPEQSWTMPRLRRRVLKSIIRAAGTPVLILPRPLGLIERAVLGWQPSREANRALHHLIDLAEAGAAVDLVTIGPVAGDSDSLQALHAEPMRHLKVHGLDAASAWVEGHDEREAELLDAYALETGADVIAVGGFAHSHLHQLFFGGVTEDLVFESDVPILIVH